MSVESPKKDNQINLPEEELISWVEMRYGDSKDEPVLSLKKAALDAIEKEDREGLKELAHNMDIKLNYLQGKSPAEWSALDGLYQKLKVFLNS